MTGSFILKYTDGRIDYISHNYMNSLNSDAKRNKLAPLRDLYRKKQLDISCSCVTPYPSMVIGYFDSSDSYFIRSKSKLDHASNCIYSSDEHLNTAASQSMYAKGFIQREDGTTAINFDGQDFRLHKESNKTVKKSELSASRRASSSGGLSQHKPSMYAATLKFVTNAWNDLIRFHYYKNQAYPTNDAKMVYHHIINHAIKNHSVNNIQLSDLLYRGEAPGKIFIIEKKHKFKMAAFTILKLDANGICREDDSYLLELQNPGKTEKQVIKAPKSLFESALKAINNIEGPYFVGGFIKSMGYGKTPQFISLGLVPINDYGVPVESSFERTLYNVLGENKRPFLTYQDSSHESWNGYIPDGLLLDTTPQTIIEVFGMSEDVESYHQQRLFKMNHFSKLDPDYNFWHWDAYKDKQIPELPKKS